MLEGWDSAYHAGRRPPWDTGRTCTELKNLIKKGSIRPGKALELGCGTGTNAIYLASEGFQVTAVDVAPTALNLAIEKAEGRCEGALAAGGRTALPELGTFDFIFDRGCYHGCAGRMRLAMSRPSDAVRVRAHGSSSWLATPTNRHRTTAPRRDGGGAASRLCALLDFEDLRRPASTRRARVAREPWPGRCSCGGRRSRSQDLGAASPTSTLRLRWTSRASRNSPRKRLD